MTRRLLRANVILESIAKVYVDVPDDMDTDGIEFAVEQLVYDMDLAVKTDPTIHLDSVTDAQGETVKIVLHPTAPDRDKWEVMSAGEWSEWRESLVDPEVERTRPAPGQYDIFGGVVEA